jgi:hypothetical protein
MRGLIVALLIVAVAVPALAVEPEGKPPSDRHRFQVGFGGGYGKVLVDETGVFAETSSTPNDFTMGMAFLLEYAYRLNPDVSIGALGYDVTITPNYAAGPRLELQAMDVGGGVTAVSSSLLFTFTF